MFLVFIRVSLRVVCRPHASAPMRFVQYQLICSWLVKNDILPDIRKHALLMSSEPSVVVEFTIHLSPFHSTSYSLSY